MEELNSKLFSIQLLDGSVVRQQVIVLLDLHFKETSVFTFWVFLFTIYKGCFLRRLGVWRIFVYFDPFSLDHSGQTVDTCSA